MKQILATLVVSFLLVSCNQPTPQPTASEPMAQAPTAPEYKEGTVAIAIHGGAGWIMRENMDANMEADIAAVLEKAITTGHQILQDGGASMDAVTATIQILENSTYFNAGKGAVFTNDGENELDASVMDGATLNAGAIAGVKRIKNPITLAREVMDNSEHVMMSGAGAEAFAKTRGFEYVDQQYFFDQDRYNALKNVQKDEAAKGNAANYRESSFDPYTRDSKYGTVGCVALDKNGNLAAGTSTGGMTNKRYGRIGDAPIIGAGTYANNKTAAVSCTGHGEYYIRGMVAYDLSAMMEYAGTSLQEASNTIIHEKNPALGGSGGLIALDRAGNYAMDFNTPGMYRAVITTDGEMIIKMYKEEDTE